MDGPRDYHTKQNKSEREKYHMILFICRIQNMTQMNVSTKQRQMHREQTCGCCGGRGKGRGVLGVWD